MQSPPKRTIRSYVRRQGRLTDGQERMFESSYESFAIPLENTTDQLAELQSFNGPRYLEIGFGNGDALAQLALQNPDSMFVGVEVHRPGIGHLLLEMGKHQLTNIRILHGDCNQLFNILKLTIQFEGIFVWFPDPWPKRKHHKRRLIQAPFLKQLEPLLKTDSYLHLATDWQDYADWMSKTMKLEKWQTISSTENLTHYLQRPNSKYEQRGLRLGHDLADLLYYKPDLSQG